MIVDSMWPYTDGKKLYLRTNKQHGTNNKDQRQKDKTGGRWKNKPTKNKEQMANFKDIKKYKKPRKNNKKTTIE